MTSKFRPPEESGPGDEHPFAPYVRILGRGPGRSRSLTRDEARLALGMVLSGQALPEQVGAFFMLLRYRGEDPDEIAGLVEAARDAAGTLPGPSGVDLDWPSYGAGRTRGQPWFLLAALALGQAGYRVLMHGSNEFSSGISVATALVALGRHPATDRADAVRHIAATGFAYLPLAALCPALDDLLRLRAALGLRSPINTVARLLDPFNARAGIDGVFHPPYIEVHLAAAERLDRPRLLVIKGGGGEAERNPAKPVRAHRFRRGLGRDELALPPFEALASSGEADLVAVWRGEDAGASATVAATIALALLGMGTAVSPEEADAMARDIWATRTI